MKVDNLTQFNLLQQRIAENNKVMELTNNRPLGGRYDTVKDTVLGGYMKIMAFVNKGIKR